MLIDSQKNRILLQDGRSVVSSDTYAKMILSGENIPEGVCIADEYDARIFKMFYGVDVFVDESSVSDIKTPDHTHTDDDIDRLIDIAVSCDRYEHSDVTEERLLREVAFFDRTNNIRFILEVFRLLTSFREHGIVWGVGRGSACSSYLLYLIGLHDVDPIKFDIKFSELTKDADDD